LPKVSPSGIVRAFSDSALQSRVGRSLVSYTRYMAQTPEARRLHTAFDLFEAGLRMMRARYRRDHPDASPDVLESMLSEWLLQRPGAPSGDAEGRAVAWPRSS
jgi:hypothetical protein